ncbi:hypothetical protein SDC9_109707 [bioreactor metagenome]|uniref:Uncharacterized protein n=1 Tax=bioreactor metagenome TaxID=1076179 RepID=A0A645BBH8_9ZZZZ
MGLLGGVVDRGGDAVELVELAFDPVRTGGAGHAADLEVEFGEVAESRGDGSLVDLGR